MVKNKVYREVPVDVYNRFVNKITEPTGEAVAKAMDKFVSNPLKKIDHSLTVSVRADRSIRKVPLQSHLNFVAYCAKNQLQVGLVLGQAMKNYFK